LRLVGAGLEGANLNGAHVEGVIADDSTRWPDGFAQS
jgi:hypothetical protein